MRNARFSFTSRETPVCPYCKIELEYRDTCKRHYRLGGGTKVWFRLRRLKCPRCKKLHRELPDILAPYKHYHLDIIMGMLEGTLTVGEDEFEDYPCEKTVERWNAWLQQNRIAIDGYMKSVGYRLLGYGEELLYSTDDLQLWRTIKTPFRSAGLAPLAPALFCCQMIFHIGCHPKGGILYGIQRNCQMAG